VVTAAASAARERVLADAGLAAQIG